MTRNKSFVGGLGCCALSLAYLWEARNFPVGSLAKPGIGFVPNLVGLIGLSLSIAIVIVAWWQTRKSKGPKPASKNNGGSGPWIIAAFLLAYPMALESLGFVLGSVPLAYVSLLVMGHRNKLTALGIAAVMVLVSFYLFSEALGVQFPAGLFG